MIVFLKYYNAVRNKHKFFSYDTDYIEKVNRKSVQNNEKFFRKRETCLGKT
jgi:hypothetical protein